MAPIFDRQFIQSIVDQSLAAASEWYLYFGIIIGCLVCESFSVVTLPFLRESFSLQMTEQECHHSRGSFLGYFWRGSDF